MASPPPLSPRPVRQRESFVLRRIVRLAAHTLGVDAAQFIPGDRGADVVAHGAPVDLRGLGIAALVLDEHGLVVTDTVGTPPFSQLAPDVRFVAAVPVVGRRRLGLLCLLDDHPRTLHPDEQQALAEFGFLAADVLENASREPTSPIAREQVPQAAPRAGDLLASLDHEIRAPLAALVGFSEALDDAVAAEHRDVSRLIVRSGHRLLATIDSVLDLARIEEGGIERVPVDVAAEVEAATQLLRPLAERKGLRLDVRVEPAPPVLADPALVSRIVHTLVDNALAFTGDGGVAVEVQAEGESVELRVRDTGKTINNAFLPRRAGAFGGAEAGTLEITRRLVRRLGGTLDVESHQGTGTAFIVRLPCRPGEAEILGGSGAAAHER